MAYDEGLAQRIREVLGDRADVEEKKMVRGHMAFGIVGEELMVRVGPDAYAASTALPHARPMTFTGKPLKSMVYVVAEGFASDHDLASWLARGLEYNATQPAKRAAPARKAAPAKRVKRGGKG